MKPTGLAFLWRKHRAGRAACVIAALCFALTGCGTTAPAAPTPAPAAAGNGVTEPAATSESPGGEIQQTEDTMAEDAEMETEMTLRINGQKVSVAWEENEAVRALRDLCAEQPLVIEMSKYGGFEQVGPIGTSLPENDRQMTAQAGDIVLYSGSRIVIFYGSNSWAYTRLGRITDRDRAGMTALLGNADAVITIALD